MNVLILAVLAATATAGWENIEPMRTEVAPAEVVWRAPAAADGYKVEKRDGAEGTVSIAGGTITVEKTNEEGMIVVTAPSFETRPGRLLRFMADVHCDRGDYFYAQASLRVYGSKESFDPDFPLEERFFYLGGADEMRGTVNQAPGMTNMKYCHFNAREGVATPVILVTGSPSRTSWRNWLADDLDAADRKWQGYFEARTARDRASERIDEEEFDRQLAADVDHTACLRRINGRTRLVVDGKIAFPSAYRAKGAFGKDILLETFAGSQVVREGVRLVVKGIAMGGSTSVADGLERRYWTPEGFDAVGAVKDIKNSLRIVPGALCMLSIKCNAYPDFTLKEHPGEVWIREDGSVVKGTAGSCVSTYDDMGMKDTNRWPWVSYASPAWRNAVKSNIRALVAELKRTGLSKRIVGLHLSGYHDGQFHSPYEDHSPMAKAEFARYLKEDPLAVDDFAYFSKLLGFRAQEDFAREFKRALGKSAVAVRWNMGAFSGMADLTAFAFSDVIDIIVPQPHYETRRPGMASEMILPYSSFNLHTKMYWNEFDLRTYAALESWAASGVVATKGLGQMDDLAMWRAGYRKLAGMMLAENCGYWFYDMGGGWFSAPEIAADIGRSLKDARAALKDEPSAWRPDAAVVADEEGFGIKRTKFKNDILRTQQQLFSASGVPFEFYLAEDVLRDPSLLGNTRIVVFAGMRRFDARRKAMMEKLARDGRTFVFLAESGIHGGAESTGFEVGFSTDDFDHVIVPAEGVPFDEARGLMASTYRRFWPYRKPTGPRGTVSEGPGVKVIARYASDSAPAIAEKVSGACRYVYVAEPSGLSPALFNRLAREAGAYVPVEAGGVQVNMSGDFISVHALKTGRFDFKLPFAAEVVNLKSGKAEMVKDGVMTLGLTAGQTCWFALKRL